MSSRLLFKNTKFKIYITGLIKTNKMHVFLSFIYFNNHPLIKHADKTANS